MDKKLRLSLIFQAAGNATKYLRGMKSETDRTSAALGAARKRVNQLQAAARDVASFKRLDAQLTGTRQKLAAAQTEAQRLGRAHAATERPTKQLTAALAAARNKVNELKDAEQRQAAGLQTVRARLDAAGVSTRRLSTSEAILARDTRKATEELERQQKRLDAVTDRQRRLTAARGRYDRTQQLAGTMQGAGASAVAGGVVTAAPLIMAGREAMTFEDGMADVRKVVDFETPQQFRQMSRDILEMSTRIPVTAEGLTQIVAAAGQAGIARAELLGFADDAAKMGIAFDTTADDAGDKMAKWRTAFRMTQPEVRSLADQINYLGNTGPANALQISNIVTRIGPLGEVAGLAAGQIAALGSTIAGMGVEEEIAATGIKNTMLALTKGEAATKAQKQAFAALGLEARAVALGMQRDAGGTIVSVMERIGRLSPERQSAILTRLFGSESVAAIAPLLTNLDLLRSNLGKVASESLYAGSMQKEFEARASTASNAVKLGVQGLKAMATEFGTAFLPQIKAGAFALRDIAGRLRTFAEAHPRVIKVAGALLAVVAAGLTIFGGLAMVVAAVLGPFAVLQLVLTQTGILFGPVIAALKAARLATLGFNLALLANPMVWIVAAIVAAVALVAYVIYRNWGKIGPWLGKLWSGISRTVGGAFDFLKNLFLTFTPLGIVIRNWGAIAEFLRWTWRLIGQLVGLGLDSIMYLLMRFTPLGFIVRNWSGITGAIGRVWTGVRGAVAAGIAAVRQAIASWGPLQAFQQAFAGVFSWFQNLPGRFLRIGTDIVKGLTLGILGRRADVQAATRSVAGAAEAGARRRLDTHSPSRVFAAIGGDVMAGFSQGIRGGAGGPIDRMRAAAAAIAAAGVVSLPGLAFAGVSPPGLTAGDDSPRTLQPSFTPGLRLAPASGSAPPATAGPGGMTIGQVTITIVQQPGEDARDLARQVADILQSPNLGRLGDDNTSWGED